MGHPVHVIQPRAEVNTSRKQYSDLGFFGTTSKPSTRCLLLKHTSEYSFFWGGKLLQNIIKGEINPINFELANKGGQVPCSIHGAQLKVHFTTPTGICSFMDKLLGVSRQWRNIKPQTVFAPVLCFTVLKFFEDQWGLMGREPHIQVVNRAVSP